MSLPIKHLFFFALVLALLSLSVGCKSTEKRTAAALVSEFFQPSLQMEGELHLFVNRSHKSVLADSTNSGTPIQALERAINAYSKREFRQASANFERFVAEMPQHRHCLEARLYLAISLLASGEDLKAKKILSDLAEHNQKHNFVPNAQWYLALALLKENNKPQAQQLLEKLAATNENPPLQLQAKQLLQEI